MSAAVLFCKLAEHTAEFVLAAAKDHHTLPHCKITHYNTLGAHEIAARKEELLETARSLLIWYTTVAIPYTLVDLPHFACSFTQLSRPFDVRAGSHCGHTWSA